MMNRSVSGILVMGMLLAKVWVGTLNLRDIPLFRQSFFLSYQPYNNSDRKCTEETSKDL